MRKAKPPRLWFREDDEIWIILDRGRQIRTGCSRDDIDGAAKALETYIGGRHTTDGFNEAYYGRPEMLLASEARRACSAWSFVGDDIISRFESELGSDLKSGRWDQRHGRLRTQPVFEGSLKLIVGAGVTLECDAFVPFRQREIVLRVQCRFDDTFVGTDVDFPSKSYAP